MAGTIYGLPSDGSLPARVHEAAALAAASRALASRLLSARYRDVPATDTPTIATWTATQALTAGRVQDLNTMTSHPGTTIDSTFGRISGAAPLEFILEGTEVEIQATVTNGYGSTWEVWVDDRPLPQKITNAEMVTNTTGYLRLQWSAPRTRRVRLMNYGVGPRSIRTPDFSGQVFPTRGTPAVGILTDSFGGATNYVTNHEAFPHVLEKDLNVHLVKSVGGGSGYISGGQLSQPYDHEKRRERLLGTGPLDAVVLFGSLNDDNASGEAAVRARLRSTWSAYASDHPGAPIVVFGVQPAGGAAMTRAEDHLRNSWMLQEAEEHHAVVAFVDMLGTARTGAVPSAWNSSATYVAGDLVVHQGAIYRLLVPTLTGNHRPEGDAVRWGRVSWVFTGTGNAGATKGDGNRDFLLGGDGVHPTASGSAAFAHLMSQALVRVLGSGGAFAYFNV